MFYTFLKIDYNGSRYFLTVKQLVYSVNDINNTKNIYFKKHWFAVVSSGTVKQRKWWEVFYQPLPVPQFPYKTAVFRGSGTSVMW